MPKYTLLDKFMNLVRQLYPTGRAWTIPENTFYEKLHKGMNEPIEDFYNASVATFDALLPDNPNFSADDATAWERRLGLITNVLSNLNDRKAAINRKMKYPGANPAKSHYLYLEKQLQDAGFNVFVYENMFALYPTGYEAKEPIDILPLGYYLQQGDGQQGDGQQGDKFTYYNNLITFAQQGSFQQGDVQQGGYVWNDRVINNLDAIKDMAFDLGGSLRDTIFIGGAPLGSFANIPVARKDEFRQIILKVKNTHIAAFLFINYV